MDFLERKTNNILKTLRQLELEQCCLHIQQQIGLWYQSQIQDQSEQASLTATPKPNDGDERTIGCFLSNIKHLESFDSDATESISSNDSYDELEGFSHEDIPPKRSLFHPRHKQSTSHYKHQVSTPSSQPHHHQQQQHQQQQLQTHNLQHNSQQLHQQQLNHQYQSLHQRGTSNQYNVCAGGAASTSSAINGNQDYSDLKKKAIWKWANERSRLASRWTWLQAQVADLEFRIRGQNDATMHARAYKTPPLPPVLPENSCSRTVPISKDFRWRRLIKSSKILSESNKKLVKFSHVPCICSSLPQTVAPCLSCNGRYNYLRQIDGENAPIAERISLLDPSCHPVLSFPDDLTLGSQISYLLKQETINRKPTKGRPGRKKGSTAANLAAAAAAAAAANGDKNAKLSGKKGKYYHGMVGRPPGSRSGFKNPSQTMITSNKLRRKYRKHSNTNNYDSNWVGSNSHTHSSRRNKRIRRASSMNESSNCSESSNLYRSNHFSYNNSAQNVSRRRRSEQSAYDIDNIVIPFSIAATTRVEVLEYKEIITPSWRVWENGTCQAETVEDEIEDTSDEAYILRHSKGESEEKKRFSLVPPKNTATTAATTPTNSTSNDLPTTANVNNETNVKDEVVLPEEDS